MKDGIKMSEKDYYIWLNSIKGVGYNTIEKILFFYGKLEPIWNASKEEIYKIPNLQKNIADKIIKHRNNEYIIQYKEKLKCKNISCIIKNENLYPDGLKNIFKPPHLINVLGSLKKSDSNSIAIVGSRKATHYGKSIAYKFAKELSEYGITIISGMAYGIDSEAHKGAIDGGGRTISVLGCGLDICYPKTNYNLMKNIIENGAVISEYPLKTKPLPGNFPQRNRIISGLAKCILVVEASLNSGSLITAEYALEQGKEVFAIPGNINSNASKGTNKLIKDGAKPITCLEDILEEFDIEYCNADKNKNLDLNNLEKRVVDIILKKQPIHIDLIGAILNLHPSQLNSIITILEIKGIIEQLPGKVIISKEI